MVPSRLQISKKDIIAIFEKYPSKIFRRSELDGILSDNRNFWRLAQATTAKEFIEFLKNTIKMKEYRFDFPSRKELRYVWGNVSDYEIIQSLKPNSYFSHFTAMSIHHLTLQIPRTIYLNFEQVKKRSPDSELTQERIDFAFKQKCRTSNNITTFGGGRVCILNGMYTGNKGVIDIDDTLGHPIRVTNIERTLIDITVRPIYSGGVSSVISAFKMAKNLVSINKLTALLSAIGYTYPYHQCIGFYMDKTKVYSQRQLSLLDQFEKKHDFYLTHQMKEIDYSKKWRIYYPRGL